MKRSMTGRELDSMSTMANCLMLLSRGADMDVFSSSPSRVFECKTCSRQFPSFQALGGHRASHKKPRLVMGGDGSLDSSQSPHGSPTKPKTHECSICGLEFAIGQALGGHMRRHRQSQAPLNLEERQQQVSLGRSSSSSSSSKVPVVKKTTSRRVLYLDLNLTPFENDLGLAPPIYG